MPNIHASGTKWRATNARTCKTAFFLKRYHEFNFFSHANTKITANYNELLTSYVANFSQSFAEDLTSLYFLLDIFQAAGGIILLKGRASQDDTFRTCNRLRAESSPRSIPDFLSDLENVLSNTLLRLRSIRRSPFPTERRLSRTIEWITYRILRKIYLIKNRNYLSCEERSFYQHFQFNWNLFISRDLYERRSCRFEYYLYLFRLLYVSSKIRKKLAISVTSSLNFVKLFRKIKVRSSSLRRV